MKKTLAGYFAFSKKDRIAVLFIAVIAAGIIAMPYFFGVKKKPQPANEQLKQQVAGLQQKKEKRTYSNERSDENTNWEKNPEAPANSNATLFEFDPNTLDEAGWVKLGLREKTARTIINYRSKGGKFRTPEDLRKIWGLRKEEADRIIPYARVAGAGNNPGLNNHKPATTNNKPILLDANTATAYDLKTLPGIGPSLPYKIVNYREKLGGFLNMLQVKETFGMTDSIFTAILPFLHVLPTEIRKININAASDFDLAGHPYIDRNLAKAITIYRTQHGGFKSVEELKKIVFVKDETYNRIAPYLMVQ